VCKLSDCDGCGKERYEALLRCQAELFKKALRRNDKLEADLAALRDPKPVPKRPDSPEPKPVPPADPGFAPVPLEKRAELVTVPSAADLDLNTFLRHLSLRHEEPGRDVKHTVAEFRVQHMISHALANGKAGHVHAEPIGKGDSKWVNARD
jgi:hypothetical protein